MGWCTVNDKYQVIVNLCRSWGNKQDSFVCYPCISHLGFKQTVMIIENSCPIFHLCSSAVEEVETSLAITSPSLPMPICTACPPASIWYKIFILQSNQSCQKSCRCEGGTLQQHSGRKQTFSCPNCWLVFLRGLGQAGQNIRNYGHFIFRYKEPFKNKDLLLWPSFPLSSCFCFDASQPCPSASKVEQVFFWWNIS